MFLQYYVTESTTGNRVNIEINAATKTDLDATRNGWQTVWNTDSSLTLKRKSMQPKPKMVRSLRWEPIVFGKEALQSTSPILRASQKATQLSGTQKIFRHR